MPRLSIVIPALDEARALAPSLERLAPLRRAGHEIIVVDGGSRDSTAAVAKPLADRVIAAPRGRALQLNAGAALAGGDVLLFLHADTHLPADAIDAIDAAVRDGARWGRFDVTIDGQSRVLPLVAALMNLRSRVTGIATGDQALFVTRAAFARAGGFPPLPLMEDIALSKQLRRVGGRPACLRQRVVTSGRRWDRHGAWRTVARMWRLRFDYWRGVDPAVLAGRYASADALAPVLQIFAKDPVPGTVKTRLGVAIGNAAAAGIYRELAERTLATAVAACDAGIVGAVELWCDPGVERETFARWRDRYGVTLRAQDGADLGQRMHHALKTALARGAPALLIGTDSPAIDATYLARAAAALASHDAVFGPAEDGGYVLVGLARDVDAFSGIAWSTEGVMAATRLQLARQGASWHEMPALWDVDTPADLARFRAWLARPVSAGR